MPSRPLIGIVDDDADILAALSSLVRSLGYCAECFSLASQLLDHSDLDTFSCVLSDIHMPMMSGLALTLRLREVAPGLPVILMTGRTDPHLEERAYGCGAISFIAKPFSLDVLAANLDGALAMHSTGRNDLQL
ncbi:MULTISPECIES: response regulator transcription factor [Rhizobium]|uniref:Response regulatory domain-containing protein n=1 Tax=Rhizobium favelukesii TaxID=348824 RepID=W6RV99_9HYPH|nr:MULTISPECIES: response regulator [Rhizobium]MCA0805578.1 response regulator [Rhizobium sp. T1473]MCS0459258.1 response regulator [Rhizobium favelukesii]UFS79077.1 response regulator [Rhizobium sp. T136]CDM62573.1 hypothetical protein LPU83_pLPU83d_1203 [Rhizobium favelukesii]